MSSPDTLSQEQPVPKFPFLIEAAQKYTSLSELLKTRPEPFWKEAVLLAETPSGTDDFPKEVSHYFVRKAGLAIRALDRGMIDLSVDKRIVYLYNYLAAQQHKLININVYSSDAIDLTQIFPFSDATQIEIINQRAAENGRYHRFESYMQALEEIQAAGRPDILLNVAGKRAINGGNYSEFDYWIEQNVKKLIEAGRRISQSDLAQSIPSELNTYFDKPIKERIYAVDTSLRRLRRLERLAPDLFLEVVKKRETILSNYLDTIDGKVLLRGSISEFGEQIGVGYVEAQRFIREYEEKHGITIHINERPKRETVTLANCILEAIDVLNKPNHTWEDNQIPIEDIIKYITEAYPDITLVSQDQINHTIKRYLDISVTTQYPEMPTRRLPKRNFYR